MDIYCPRCAEPWDNDCIHEEVQARQEQGQDANYQTVACEFRRKGCAAFSTAYGLQQCETPTSNAQYMRATLAGAAYELLGDDMDGAAAELEDYFYANGL